MLRCSNRNRSVHLDVRVKASRSRSASEMFDWNEDELSDIIWAEADVSDDHIVPYPKEHGPTKLRRDEGFSKNQTGQEASHILNCRGDRTYGDRDGSFISKMEGSSCFNRSEELLPSAPRPEMDSWPANTSNQDPIGNKGPSGFPDVTNLESIKDEPHADSRWYGNDYEDKDGSSFLDCSWADIVDFEDFDSIFRNSDSVFGNDYIGHTNELWSSSDNLVASPYHAYTIGASSPVTDAIENESTSVRLSSGSEFKPSKCQELVHGCNEFTGAAELKSESSEEKTESTETTAETTSELHANVSKAIHLLVGDKIKRKKRHRKKIEGKNKEKSFSTFYSVWSPSSNQNGQCDNMKMNASTNSIPQGFPPFILSPFGQHGGLESLRYQHASSSVKSMAHGYPTNYVPVIPVSFTRSEWDRSQMVMAECNYSLGSSTPSNYQKNLEDFTCTRSAMTPQEKIEKLRRRQQVQAMLAIQQQKQQLGQQAAYTNISVSMKSSQENEVHGSFQCNSEDKNVTKFSSQELNLLTEQEDSSKISSLNDEFTLEETIFNKLQDVIEKLNFKTRISIRDSLYRLAKSAIQRNNMSSINSTNKSFIDEDILFTEETCSDYRSAHISDTETDTNLIDRTVAHLLFHRPADSSRTPDGYADLHIPCKAEKQPFQQKTEGLSSPTNCISKSLTEQQSDHYQDRPTKLSCLLDSEQDNQH